MDHQDDEQSEKTFFSNPAATHRNQLAAVGYTSNFLKAVVPITVVSLDVHGN